MALTLGFDTSADACAVAVLREGQLLAADRRTMSRGHAEALVPMVLGVFAQASESLADCDRIGVTVGPGSFTGVRTGLAAARGFAAATGARAIGVSSLQAVARGAFRAAAAPAPERVLCILDTRRSDFFAQAFDRDLVPEALPAVLDAEGVRRLLTGDELLAGNAVARFADGFGAGADGWRIAPGCEAPGAEDVARIADLACDAAERAGEKGMEHSLSPLYLRPPEAKLPKDGGRLRK